jgi:S-(hydroxymethyl)glutathione dehydrogenase/alcohol dehydrogenase
MRSITRARSLSPSCAAFAFAAKRSLASRSFASSALHGSGCACCAPPSGAASWVAPSNGGAGAVRRPISFSASGTGETIECDAAVAFGVDDVRITKVKVAPPRPGEVRLKVVANALCHTDLYTLEGSDPEGRFPCILGHEAGAIVESVGEGVTSVKPGDHVIPCYTPECRQPDCIFCASSKTNLCPRIRTTQGQGVMPDGTSRFAIASDGTPIHHFMGCSTFSEYTVVAEISCAKVDPRADLATVCLLGCGVTTGVGAVRKTTAVEPGSTVGVFGLGAVGLACVQAAKAAGARRIWAIDTNPDKFGAALEFGATDTLNPSECEKPVQQELVSRTTWGLDYTFDCTGNTAVMRAALEAAHRGWGTSCVIGVAAAGQEISTRPFQLVTGRRWVGTAFGGIKSRTEVPKLVNEYLDDKLPLAPYITHRFQGVGAIMDAIDAMHSGKVLRAVVTY